MNNPDMNDRRSLIAALEARAREELASEPPDSYDIEGALEYWRTLDLESLQLEWNSRAIDRSTVTDKEFMGRLRQYMADNPDDERWNIGRGQVIIVIHTAPDEPDCYFGPFADATEATKHAEAVPIMQAYTIHPITAPGDLSSLPRNFTWSQEP